MLKNLKIICLFIIVVFSSYASNAQQIQMQNFGINGGVVIAIGNKFDRIGLNIKAYYAKDFAQVNAGASIYINFKNLGPKKQYVEGVVNLGLVLGYGKHTNDTNFFYTSVSNQTGLKNSFGYSFNYFFNAIGTSQQVGIFSFQFNKINFIAENDLFAHPRLDRFRTGAFLLQYRQDKLQFGINSTFFTGQMGNEIIDENYPFSHLYKDTIGGKYTQYSNGLLSAQMQYVLPYYQNTQANIGIDAEKFRNAVQNRFFHDMPFLPKKWNKEQHAHIPMLNDKGGQYLYKENQNVKPASIYFNLFSNPNLFY